jgi:selenide,water dikinase
MRCGGCGSKIGATMLREVLGELSPRHNEAVLIGLRHPDDAAIVRLPPNTVSVQTVDAFRSFIDDPWVFGKVAASHGLSDIFAMGATPQSALAIATLPLAKESAMRQDLLQMMSGALEVLQAEQTTLVGGHTSEGVELSLGFALNGFVETERELRKTGASVGDSLIITKPIGTGALFAGAMQGRSRSRWLEAALDVMIQTNGAAASCLLRHGATAMTDVTGFGLVGHLLEMLGGGQLQAEFELERLPILDGAVELMNAGISSSLHDQNQKASERTACDDDTCQHPHYKLSFDPQTSGGLLAAVSSDQSSACVEELRKNGCPQATVIGQFIESDIVEKIVVRK